MGYYEKFAALCKECRLSPTGAALQLGLSNAAATQWRKGAVPSGPVLRSVAEFFGVDEAWLAGYSDSRHGSRRIVLRVEETGEEIEYLPAEMESADGYTAHIFENGCFCDFETKGTVILSSNKNAKSDLVAIRTGKNGVQIRNSKKIDGSLILYGGGEPPRKAEEDEIVGSVVEVRIRP